MFQVRNVTIEIFMIMMDAHQHDKSNMDMNEILVIRRRNDKLEDQYAEMELETPILVFLLLNIVMMVILLILMAEVINEQLKRAIFVVAGVQLQKTHEFENQFMPTATLKVMPNNDLLITFNDTIAIVGHN